MGNKENKRQRQLAKKKQKRKDKKALAPSPINETTQMLKIAKQAAILPVYESFVPEELFQERGIGTVLVSRKMALGDLAISVILLDVYCLGVKDAYFKVVSPQEYKEMLNHISMNENLKSVEPACVRKLVEECIAFAKNIGFDPHPDYKLAQYIFGDIEINNCTEVYEFGKEGKPYYISGPHDSDQKIRRIMKTLEQNCGEGNFDYLVGIPGV